MCFLAKCRVSAMVMNKLAIDLPRKKIDFLIALPVVLKIIPRPMNKARMRKPIPQKVFLIVLPMKKIALRKSQIGNKIVLLVPLPIAKIVFLNGLLINIKNFLR